MIRHEGLHPCQIGNRTRHFENAIIGPGAQLQVRHRMLEHLVRAFIESAERANLPKVKELDSGSKLKVID